MTPNSNPEPNTGEIDGLSAETPTAAQIEELGAPLLEALVSHFPPAHQHSQACAAYAHAAAAGLGLDRDHAELVRELARLHEIGQVLIPVGILARPPIELDESGIRQLATRFEHSAELARSAGLPESVCYWLANIPRRPDTEPSGTGTDNPGAAIPLESRIVAAACACDQILVSTVNLPGTEDEHIAAAVRQINHLSGSALDTGVVAVLTDALAAP